MRTVFAFIAMLMVVVTQTMAAKPFETMQWQTKSGARVVFYQAMEVPMLDISIAFAAGSAYDGESFGLSSLTTRLLNQGNGGVDANSIAEKLADTGAQFSAESNRDMIVLSLKTLTSKGPLQKASETFASIIDHPDFPIESFNREKNQQLMAIDQSQESPDSVANNTFFQILYKNHPYAHPIIGIKETVNPLNVDQVRRFYQQFFVSSNAVIVLVGAIDKPQAEQLANQITNDLPVGHPAPSVPNAEPLTEEMNIEVKFPSSQTVLRLGQLGINHHDSNYFPLLVGNYILGGGSLVSRLADELREKNGLTYGVYSQFAPMPGTGPFIISLSTENSQTSTAIGITRETLVNFVKTGPDEQELIAAKQYLTGSYPLALASNKSIADMLLKIAFYHLPDDYLPTYISHVTEVTTLNIKQAFQQLVTPDKLLQVTVGKA